MNTLKGSKLNNLLTNWQQGAVYTATWLAQQGFSSSAIAGYCQSNWLRSIGRGAFVKVGDTLDVDTLDLGVGNRSIVAGGRLDSKYKITVPVGLGLN
jgi:Transcriptional regulator, AbiEi antitoxin N-terminal domain/Transcriptional regulator, AbiEi antitoxin, Type IV TA system